MIELVIFAVVVILVALGVIFKETDKPITWTRTSILKYVFFMVGIFMIPSGLLTASNLATIKYGAAAVNVSAHLMFLSRISLWLAVFMGIYFTVLVLWALIEYVKDSPKDMEVDFEKQFDNPFKKMGKF